MGRLVFVAEMKYSLAPRVAEMKGLSDSRLHHIGAMGPFRCVRFKLRQMARFHQLTPRTQQSQIANASSTLPTPTGIKKIPHAGHFFIPGGDEGIRTLDTLASIPHFQCGALDQLCDISGSGIILRRLIQQFLVLRRR